MPSRRGVLLGCLALAVAGCTSGRASTAAPGFAETRCEGVAVRGARCATQTVFEDRLLRGRTIALRVVVLPALGSRAPDPVFYLAGGPGQGATDLMRNPAVGSSPLREHRDLVFVDQRGTGGSNPLRCSFYGPPDDTQSYFDAFLPITKVRACRERLAPLADLAQYTTAASVDDLDEVRIALGAPRINLIGGSYGTRLAMEYVRKHEAHVRTVVLEGAVPPSLRIPEAFGRYAQRSLDLLLDECTGSPACAAAFPDIRRQAQRVFERLRAGPVEARVMHPSLQRPADVTLTRNHVGEAIRYMTYSSHEAGRVPRAIAEAFDGDYSAIAQDLLRRRAGGTFDGLYLSITCAEDVPFVSPDAAERDEPTYLGGYRVREQRAACAEWPRGAAPAWRDRPVTASVPVLILSGELDPVAPPELGDEVARTLPNSLHVRVPHAGHSPAGLNGLECLQQLRRQFIEAGVPGGLDLGCVAKISRPPFATRQ